MEIKRTDASRFTPSEQVSKQAELTEAGANFRTIQEKAKARHQDEMTQNVYDVLEGILGHPLGPDLPNADTFRPDDNNSSDDTNNPTPIPTSDSYEKQKLFNELRSQFNKPPEISSDTIDKQSKFTEAVADFKEIQERAKENALRRQGQEALSGALTQPYNPLDPTTSGLGPTIPSMSQLRGGRSGSSEPKKPHPVPTSESYTKQKLFTELMESNKKSLDKK